MSDFSRFIKKLATIDTNIYDLSDFSMLNEESLAFWVALTFYNQPKKMVIVKENLLAAQNFYNILSFSLKEKCNLYCVDEVSKFTSVATSPEIEASRLYVLAKLMQDDEPFVIVTHAMALQRLLPSYDLFKKSIINLKIGQKNTKKAMIDRLVKMGYKNVLQVTQAFEFSSRGGVIDIYSVQYENAIRVEFFDDEIDSIRFFDIETQRTISVISSCMIMPATEFLIDDMASGIDKIKENLQEQSRNHDHQLVLQEKIQSDINKIENYQFDESLYRYYGYFNHHATIVDYLKDASFVICNRETLIQSSHFHEDETYQLMNDLFENGQTLSGMFLLYPITEVLSLITNEIDVQIGINMPMQEKYEFHKVDTFNFNYHLLELALQDWLEKDNIIYIGLENPVQYESLINFLKEKELPYEIYQENTKLRPHMIYMAKDDFHIGLNMVHYRCVLLGENEIFKKHYRIKGQFSSFKNAVTIESISDIQIGDYLVHDHHGIGIYRGIETMESNGIHRDYLKIEYKNQDALYVALENFKLVRKYVSKDGVVPTIHKLGSKEWEKTKSKVKERVRDIAEKLINLYSLRSQKQGFAFLKDDEYMVAFENDFGYTLTKDQQKALDEIKQDMESSDIMDRLLCGDVGFGKTEVAFRAAFKAMYSGKQVALLCPTTLLARQHYLTALERFKNYGVRIALLSRKVGPKEQENIIKKLKENQIDFVIGTHRLLSQDIHFADLGFLIIDEEHKFGVEHKERIKELKANIDVLTLSATPIPRTLQMALTGVRGFSSINTPIENRLPVQTYVLEKNDFAVKEIIERELARKGQVYYLHNRIEDLPSIGNKLKKLVPSLKIAIIHGKMSAEMVDDIMEDFILGNSNLLLCTTVIENGIDIPNVNTIIVDNADHFGLSQLYQIRGRVGRSDRLAYAYLFYHSHKNLSEIAQKRLATIKEFTNLGSGYKVAMRDLITRGAGDLLGAEQSGFIESVGMDMYIDMLHEAIEEKKTGVVNEQKLEKKHPNLNIDAYIPQGFFNNDYEKIELYKQIDRINEIESLNQLKDELSDKVGKLPDSIKLLFEKKVIDIFEDEGMIDSYRETDKEMVLSLSDEFSNYRGIGLDIFELANQISNSINLKFPKMRIEVHFAKVDQWLYYVSDFIKGLIPIKKKYKEGSL